MPPNRLEFVGTCVFDRLSARACDDLRDVLGPGVSCTLPGQMRRDEDDDDGMDTSGEIRRKQAEELAREDRERERLVEAERQRQQEEAERRRREAEE